MIESCIENNDVLSRKNLMKNLNKLHVKKTKIIHFDIKNNDDDKIVFLCEWTSRKLSDIHYYNRKFAMEMGI